MERMNKIAIAALCVMFSVFLAGCALFPPTLTTVCRHEVLAQEAAAVEKYGRDNVQVWRLKNPVDSQYKYHAQVKVRVNGTWFWVPNYPRTYQLKRTPQSGKQMELIND